MTRFSTWCTTQDTSVNTHKLSVLDAQSISLPAAVSAVAKCIPEHYASLERLNGALKRLKRPGAMKMLKEKLPTIKSAKSGDLGEILCTSYLREETIYKIGIYRLRWKDHRQMAMRGDDVLGFSIDATTKKILFVKAEVKSRVSLTTKTIDEAREALSSHRGLPSPHSILFVTDRMFELGNIDVQNAIDDALLMTNIRKNQVTHMMFTFSSGNPTNLLTTNLQSYKGSIKQHYVGLRVKEHQAFIKNVYKSVTL